MEFEKRKAKTMEEMESAAADKSPKGSIDAPVISLLHTLNLHPSFFSTSSCSGRISVFFHPILNPIHAHGINDAVVDNAENTATALMETAAITKKNKKKKAGGGSWVYISHEPADPDAVLRLLFQSPPLSSTSPGQLVFRFEPFILAVDCRDAASAAELVSTAISSGFRESGITSLQKRIMVAIRCSIRLEVPLGERDHLLVSPEYVRHLVGIANEKMEANKKRFDVFHHVLRGMVLSASASLKVDNHCKLQILFADQGSVAAHEGKPKELLVDNRLTCTEVQTLYSMQDTCTNGVDGHIPDTARICTEDEETSACKKLMTNIVHCNQSSDGDKIVEKTIKDFDLCTSFEEKCHLSAVKITITGESVERLFLWGHSACTLTNLSPKKILLFGGFGGLGRHARRNDTLMLGPVLGTLEALNADGPPSPRMGHSLSVVGELVFVIGGRGGPLQIMNDVWVLHTDKNKWRLLECAGNVFHPRHRHAAAVVGSKVFVFGGLNNEVIYSCMHMLDTESLLWYKVSIQGEWPCARHSHSMVAHGSQLFMFGGYDGQNALGDLYSFDVGTCLWKKENTIGRSPFARFSHSMFVYHHYIGIFGGCPVEKHFEEVALLDLRYRSWKYVTVYSISRDLFVRCTTCVIDDDIVVVGGGSSCYAFGTKFNEPMKMDLRPLMHSVRVPFTMEDNPVFQSKEVGESHINSFCIPNDTISVTNVNKLTCSNNGKSLFIESKPMVLKLSKKNAKLGKDILKKNGWLDPGRKVYSSDDGLYICLPVTNFFFPFLQDGGDLLNAVHGSDSYESRLPSTGNDFTFNEDPFKIAMNLLLVCGGSIHVDYVNNIREAPKSPQKMLREAMCFLIRQKGWCLQLLEQLPSRWERLGDIVVLPVSSFKDAIWDTIGEELWPIVAKLLGAKRLARQGRIMANGTRDSTLEILVGDNGWVDHIENDIIYFFDSTKCMFSSGNLSEKLRMAQLDCANEVVVDLFSGIGYFVLPFLVKAKAKLVYACEWNAPAIEALRRNIHVNGVADRCIILEGDNRLTAPKGVADRVCLGLLPTSEGSWVTAVRALRREGGVLHVHGNVKDSEEDSWSQHVVMSIDGISKAEGYSWDVSIQHLERVKWYGPHIRHVVADVKCNQLKV